MNTRFNYIKRIRKEFKLLPEILIHPNIPRPLHGTAPRVIFGEDWWDGERRKVSREYRYSCLVCGKNAEQDKFEKRWLHCHEYYKVDYVKLVAEFIRIVPLCYSCHMFIHSGRLNAIYEKGELDISEIKYILNRGISILRTNDLKPFINTLVTWNKLNGIKDLDSIKEFKRIEDLELNNWDKWKMIINGKYHDGHFKTQEEWEEFYK